jgi:hypothetical protein
MKSWEKPKLVVLARSEPEEAVLLACKTGTTVSNTVSGVEDTHNTGKYCVDSNPCPVCSVATTT